MPFMLVIVVNHQQLEHSYQQMQALLKSQICNNVIFETINILSIITESTFSFSES